MPYQPRPNATDSERIALIEQMMGDMQYRLFGNGQPGQLQRIDRRLARLESWRSKWAGAAALAALLLSALPKLKDLLHL